jgi:hypothetical protein
VNWNWNILLQNNKPSFNLIFAKMAKKCPVNILILKFFCVHNSAKMAKKSPEN